MHILSPFRKLPTQLAGAAAIRMTAIANATFVASVHCSAWARFRAKIAPQTTGFTRDRTVTMA